MIRYLNHLAIAVPDMAKAVELYQDVFGLNVSEPHDLPDHGVTVAVVELPNIQIELVSPLGSDSPVAKFLKKHPLGGLHHISFEVDDVSAAKAHLLDSKRVPLGDGKPKEGFHETPTLFYSPSDFMGVLVEIEQKAKGSQPPLSPVRTKVSEHLSKESKKFKEQGAHVRVFMEDWY